MYRSMTNQPPRLTPRIQSFVGSGRWSMMEEEDEGETILLFRRVVVMIVDGVAFYVDVDGLMGR
jgi:hypothetical protein